MEQNFLGSFVRNYLKTHGMTTITLSGLLKYKSTTSLFRVLGGKANSESIRKFAEMFTACPELTMDQEERSAFFRAVDISLYGYSRYQLINEIWKMLRGTEPERANITVAEADTGRVIALEKYLETMENAEIRLLNCGYVPLYELLARNLKKDGWKVDHYVFYEKDSACIVHTVNALLPVFYESGYRCYSRANEREDNHVTGVLASDMMMCRYTRNGRHFDDTVIFTSADKGILHRHAGVQVDACALLGIDTASFRPFKRTYFESTAFEDYIQYTEDYAALECNHPVYKIKPDIGIDYIPVDILHAAALEGPIPHDESFEIIMLAMYDVYSRRVHNTYNKKEPAFTVMKRSAMRKFALTGMTSDHFWGMRPYTPEERIRILKTILYHQINNPYFHMHFLRDDTIICDMEIAYYEGIGMLMLDAQTDYNLAEGHCEALITFDGFLSIFKDFMIKRLIPEYVISDSETVQFLNSLIQMCRNDQP